MIDLDRIVEDNELILSIYSNSNQRTNKKEVFIPYAVEESIDKNDEIKEFKEIKPLNSSSNSIDEFNSFLNGMIDSVKPTNPVGLVRTSNRPQKKHSIDINIEEFLNAEFETFSSKDTKSSNKALNTVKKPLNDVGTRTIKPMPISPVEQPIRTNSGLNNNVSNPKILKELDVEANYKSLFGKSSSMQSSLSKETQDMVEKVYGYLFDTFETFSAVFDNYNEFFEKIEDVKTFQPNKMPAKINVRDFLLKYRRSDLLAVKLNLIAMSIGNYNLHLIVDKYKCASDFVDKNKETFLMELKKNYDGSEFDVAYLKEFLKVVEGDLSGKYVFSEEELSAKKPKKVSETKEVKEPVKNVKKEKKNFFSLNKKK